MLSAISKMIGVLAGAIAIMGLALPATDATAQPAPQAAERAAPLCLDSGPEAQGAEQPTARPDEHPDLAFDARSVPRGLCEAQPADDPGEDDAIRPLDDPGEDDGDGGIAR